MYQAPNVQFTRSNTGRRQDVPLSEDQIRRAAPSVFAAEAHDSRSQRYAYIPTVDIVRALKAEGFEVFSALQSGCRSEDRREHTKHMLRLRHMGQAARAQEVGDSVAEICLVNSHDGTSAYRMFAGMFRLICRNGLMVADTTVGEVKVPHSGHARDRVVEGAHEILDGCTRVVEMRDEMQAIALTPDEQQVFAGAALTLRYDEGAAPITAEQLLQVRRHEDRKSDLWTTLNRVQENAVRGGLQGRSARNKPTTTREVRGIDQSVKLNRALWMLADEMTKLKSKP